MLSRGLISLSGAHLSLYLFESKDFLRALDVVQTILEPLALRRTKDMKTPSGEALVTLPLKTIEILKIKLSKEEQEVYDYILNRAKQSFEANVEAGTVLKAYTSNICSRNASPTILLSPLIDKKSQNSN